MIEKKLSYCVLLLFSVAVYSALILTCRLGDVLNSLTSKKDIVPYGNSMLTKVLADSLGNQLIIVLVNIFFNINFVMLVIVIHIIHTDPHADSYLCAIISALEGKESYYSVRFILCVLV